MPIDTRAFYATYHGHRTEFLEKVLHELKRDHTGVVYFAGDSSLDNKYWFEKWFPAIGGYERILQPAQMKADVAYWLNREFTTRPGAQGLCCLNTAIEATSLNDRACCLQPQDKFIQDNITEEDYLVVSVGGNDIALTPLLFTALNLLAMVWCTPQACLDDCACACPPNSHVDCGCAGCGLPGCLTGTLCGWPPGLGYFVDLFKNRVQNYVSSLVSKRKPKKVVICMIYFPDEDGAGSWADGALGCMCYNSNPSKLQSAIRAVFRLATSRISIPGTEVIPFPLYEVLNGSDTEDYLQRVEPSPEGGRKMAAAFADAILHGAVPARR